ncbi:MAG: tetratricopeptide repeat protein [Planctomycetota bacterium]|nr:tetratricopeptide repeat protein [Planctomycetota bacterium]
MIVCTTLLLVAQSTSSPSIDEMVAAATALGQQTEAGIAAGEITGLDAVDSWTDVAYAWEDISKLENAPSIVWVNWSEAALNAGSNSNAINIIESGIEIFNNDANILEQHGRLLMVESRSVAAMGNVDRAAEFTAAATAAFLRAAEAAPESASPLLRLGELSWTEFVNSGSNDSEMKDAALNWWLKAATVEPAAVDSGTVYNWLQTDSVKVIDLLVSSDPEQVLHYWYRGMAHYALGPDNWSKVHEDFKKVLDLNPNFTNAYFFLADGAFQRGAMQSAAKDDVKAKRAYNFSGKYYALYLRDFGANHAQSVAQNGGMLAECQRMNFLASFTDYEHAIMILEWATVNAPDYLDVWNNLAFLYRETGQAEKSLAAYQQALSIAPADPQIMNDLAVIYHYYLKTEDEIALELYANATVKAEEILANSEAHPDADLDLVKIALRDSRNNLNKLKKGNRRNG